MSNLCYEIAEDLRHPRRAGRYHLPELAQEWECVMEAYSTFCGNWSDSQNRYIRVALGGGHRAVGDALAALERVREMATVYEREDVEQGQS